MICRLCLKDTLSAFSIFDDRGMQLQIAETIAKYFWFEPKSDDPISTVICSSCWSKIAEFNEFYKIVEEAHRLLTERFSFKLENKAKRKEDAIFENKSCEVTVEESAECIRVVEATSPHTATDSFVALFDEVLDNRSSDTLAKVNTELSLVAEDVSFDGENEFTEYLSFDEQDKLEKVIHLIAAGNDESNESKRITRAESKRKQTTTISPTLTPKKRIESEKSPDKEVCVKMKRCGRPRKKLPLGTLVQSETKNISAKEEDNPDSAGKKCKYQNIDERIAKYLSLQCDICGSTEASFIELSKHMNSVHDTRGYLNCCNKKFYRRSHLYHHIEKHLNPDCLKCQECDKTFADKQCLRNHMLLKHQPDEAKIFGCKFCEKRFAKPYLLEQHQKKHEERNHICEVCQKGFSTTSLLHAHIKVIHNNYGTMCEICAKVIRGRSAFARHVLEHQGVTLPRVQCPKCGSWYKDKHSLQKHIRRHNEEGIEHRCNECGKTAPNRSAMLAHKRYVHKERMFECNICKKSFKKQIGLKEHMAQHTGQTLYNCPHCPRTFNSNANMHSHRKKMHPKEFAEARLKRHHETKIMVPKNDISDNSTEHEHNEEIITVDEHQHHLMLTSDDETHILISAEKLNELVFKVS